MVHAEKPFNLWRGRSYEPPIRAYLRGTTALIALVLLVLFAVFIISSVADRNQTYALRTFRHSESPPQPNLFTNHCTSALAERANLDEFAQLVRASTRCQSITGSIVSYLYVDCAPVWYNVTKAFIRDTNRFRNYYAAQDTELCLGLECPKCAERPTDGAQPAFGWNQISVALNWPTIAGDNVIWRKEQIPWVGQTAIWLWAPTPNEKNGRDRGLPFNTADPPFTSNNRTHTVIELSYEESGEANSNGFFDFIGWKTGLWKQGHYSASLVTGNRFSPFDVTSHSTIEFNQKPWPGWLESQQYTVTTLPGVVGTLGGLWSAFNGIFILLFGTSFAFLLFGSKLISITPKWAIRRPVASARLDSIYLTSGKPIDEEERLRALTAYMADLVVDTGELDLTIGRIPGGAQEVPGLAAESEGGVIDVTLRSRDSRSEPEPKALAVN